MSATGESARLIAEPELRQISVFFCDLVGSTPLAQVMDAEDYHELIQEYQRTVAGVIQQYEGHVARTFGDGILVLFGHPLAHEDDAERAIRAAGDALHAMKQSNETRPGLPPLSIRIGIHTGPAVISHAAAGDGTEVQALGDAVNLAARLQGFAEPDTTVISATTLKLVAGLFVTRDLGEQALKGIQQPIQLYQVIEATSARTRLEAASRLTPFVGRRQELDLLNDRWRRAAAGEGQAVLLSAEPGIGKSRLLMTLREQIERSATWLECRCSPLARNTAFSPLLDLVNRSLHTPSDVDNQIRLAALEQSLLNSGQDPGEAVPLLAPLLNIKLAGRFTPAEYGADLKRRKTLAVLSRWCLGQAARGPTALVVEDLHWADPSTVEVLGTLIEHVTPHAMMVVPSARPEFSPDWPALPQFSLLTLEPLDGDETAAIVDAITCHRPLPTPVRDRLLKQAGGVPLFLEEATKALLESGQLVEQDGRFELSGRLDHLSIPATLQDTLMARLDRLGEARPLIQLCAVIGRNVPFTLLQQAAELDAAAVQRHLDTLVGAQLLFLRGADADATYTFKHALIQDAAYGSIWKKTRARLHGRAARAIEQLLPQWAKAAPEMLALHWEAAGDVRRALDYRKAAGRLAARSSFTEATEHAQKALALLASLPKNEERLSLELDVNLTLSEIVSAAGVVGSANPDGVYARVRELCAQVEDPVLVGRALAASWVVQYQRCDYTATLDIGTQLLAIGRKTQRRGMEIVGWIARGLAHFSRGEQRQALECARNAETLTDAARESAESRVAYDLILPRQYIEIVAHALLGQPDSALRIARDMVARADAARHPFLQMFTRTKAGAVDLFRSDWEAVIRAAPEAIRLGEQIGDQDQLSDARWEQAIALCQLGRFHEGLPLYREVIEHEMRWQAPHWHSFVHGCVADALLRAGRLDEAQAALASAFQMMEQHHERFWEADLHRVRGELLKARGAAPAEIQQCLDRALEVARAQGTRLLELRAATSQALYWHGLGRAAEGHALLQAVRGALDEGTDTKDARCADDVLALLAS